jgi:hypothetical protein
MRLVDVMRPRSGVASTRGLWPIWRTAPFDRVSRSCRRRSTASTVSTSPAAAMAHEIIRGRPQGCRRPGRAASSDQIRRTAATCNCRPTRGTAPLARPGPDRRRSLSLHSGGTRLIRTRCRACRQLSIAGELKQIADVVPVAARSSVNCR